MDFNYNLCSLNELHINNTYLLSIFFFIKIYKPFVSSLKMVIAWCFSYCYNFVIFQTKPIDVHSGEWPLNSYRIDPVDIG